MIENKPRKVIRTRIVKQWLADLSDEQGKGAISDRIDRMKHGNFGKVHTIRSEPGLFEMIVDEGPGYRVYFGEFDGDVVVLILGGPKSKQDADIRKAGAALRWLKAKEAAEKTGKEAEVAEKTARKDLGRKTNPKGSRS